MGAPAQDEKRRQACLSQALKAIRRRRGLRPAEVAAAMCMPLRSYEYFESGRGRLNVDRVHLFARATDCDPYAILTAREIGSPAFAVRCMDNKLATILQMAVQDFDAIAGDHIARLPPRTLIEAFTRAFDGLAATAREGEIFLERWMSDKALGGDGGDDPPDGL